LFKFLAISFYPFSFLHKESYLPLNDAAIFFNGYQRGVKIFPTTSTTSFTKKSHLLNDGSLVLILITF